MTAKSAARAVVAAILVGLTIAGAVVGGQFSVQHSRTMVAGYFPTSTGLFPGDDVRVLGVPVGKVDRIEPMPDHVKIWFWVDEKYPVPADVKAVILSPQLVTGRAIQLTPAYTGGPTLSAGAEIPESRTAVPVEWDDIRDQLERINALLAPTRPGGVSALGEFINTAAANLRGQGPSIRDTIVKLSQTVSVLSDHSDDIFATFKNLSVLVSALRDSADLLERLNENLAAVTSLLADDPTKVSRMLTSLNAVTGDLQTFASENAAALGTTADKLESSTTMLVGSIDDVEQALHVAPTTLQNFSNIYEPANGSFTGALAVNNFANPIAFLCGAIQAASRMNAEQSSKLCVQYLAPIVKNRQYNWPPLGFDLFVGAQARPNEVTYSEEWMRPDYVPPPAPSEPLLPLAAEAPDQPVTVSTDPTAGLYGVMVPDGGGR